MTLGTTEVHSHKGPHTGARFIDEGGIISNSFENKYFCKFPPTNHAVLYNIGTAKREPKRF